MGLAASAAARMAVSIWSPIPPADAAVAARPASIRAAAPRNVPGTPCWVATLGGGSEGGLGLADERVDDVEEPVPPGAHRIELREHRRCGTRASRSPSAACVTTSAAAARAWRSSRAAAGSAAACSADWALRLMLLFP